MDLLDSFGMFDLAAALPEQVAEAARADVDLEGLPAHDDVEHVVLLAAGAERVAALAVRAVAAPFLSVPLVVGSGYEAPAFTGAGTLCIALSASGDTEEAVEAAEAAATTGARLVTCSGGGRLCDLAGAWGVPHLDLPDLPAARAGIGAATVLPLLVLEQVGLLPGARRYAEDAADQLRRRRDELIVDGSAAQRLAATIGRTFPVAYGGEALGEVAALRFKLQVNANAKAPASWATLPELRHDEVCGWGQHGDVTRQVLTAVRFRHDFEHPQVSRAFELQQPVLDEVVHDVVDVRAAGEGALAQLLDLVLQGDVTSLHLAALAGVDPGPTPTADDLAAALHR